jgi:hypothetical protein
VKLSAVYSSKLEDQEGIDSSNNTVILQKKLCRAADRMIKNGEFCAAKIIDRLDYFLFIPRHYYSFDPHTSGILLRSRIDLTPHWCFLRRNRTHWHKDGQ